ncbi:hypothetical protein DdX_02772 [Ditylenchus destructor]|nr:hypothetical protein DdX_02772 [Ditylenchus destructor]
MRTKNIPSEILTEIFAFLPRRNLLSARGVNNKFNTIIRSDFSTNPLLIIDVFFYGHDKCAWIASKENSQDYAFMPTELASELLRTQKFLRFRESTIQLGNQPISTEFIEAINHTWDQEHLNVEWTYLAPSPAFIKNILSCRTLKLHCDGALSVISDILESECERLEIIDSGYVTAIHLPVADFVNFLFKSASDKEKRRILAIQTENIPGREWCEHLVTSVKQKFTSNSSIRNFEFRWAYKKGRQWIASTQNTTNKKNNQRLAMEFSNHFGAKEFYMYTLPSHR